MVQIIHKDFLNLKNSILKIQISNNLHLNTEIQKSIVNTKYTNFNFTKFKPSTIIKIHGETIHLRNL